MRQFSNDKAPATKSPSHAAYLIQEIKNGDSIWTRIGSAWQHADGEGFNIKIETLPISGRFTLRVPTARDA